MYPDSDLTKKIIGAAIEVHKELGPGLLESVYEECMYYELKQLGMYVKRQAIMPVSYKEIDLDCGYRVDLLIEDRIIVELKAVSRITFNRTRVELKLIKSVPSSICPDF